MHRPAFHTAWASFQQINVPVPDVGRIIGGKVGIDHVTIFNGSMCADSCHFAGDPHNGTFVPKKSCVMEAAMKKFTLLMSVMLLLGCSHSQTCKETLPRGVYGNPKTQDYSAQELLKNWALSRCFGAITQDKTARDDAYATAGGYFEFSNRSLETFEEIDALVKSYVHKKYSGIQPSEFNTMKCIDMFHSKKLEAIITASDKRVNNAQKQQ